MTAGEKLDQILYLLENEIEFCNRACKSSDDFEIALQFFQEYAESVEFSLIFKDFVQELKFLPGKYTVPRGCIFLARNESVGVGYESFCPVFQEDIRFFK